MVASVLAFNYSPHIAWWRSSVATAFVLFFGYCAWRKQFRTTCGLQIGVKQCLSSIGIASVVTSCSFLIVQRICVSENVSMYRPSMTDWYHHFFQTVNEEIVFGALPIFALRKSFSKANPLLFSLLLAVAFSAGHFAFYGWFSREKETLEIAALASLFFIGVVRNNLIVRFNHIGYSWAIHFGFIVALLGAPKIWNASNTMIAEVETFNLFLRLPIVLILLSISAAASFRRHGGRLITSPTM